MMKPSTAITLKAVPDVRAKIDSSRPGNSHDVMPQTGDAFSYLPDPVLYANAEGDVNALNATGDELLLQAKNSTNPTLFPCIRALAKDALAAQSAVSQSIEWAAYRQKRWMDATAVPDNDAGAFVICRDSTLNVTMRSALIESRQRFKELVEISSDFAWETDVSGTFTFVSTSGALDYPPDALIGTAARDLLFQATATPSALVFEADAIAESRELWLRRSDGEAVCVLASARPIQGEQGQRTGTRGVCRDITADRLRENDLARLKVREQIIDYIVDAVRNEANPLDMLSTAVSSIGKALSDTACAVYRRQEDGGLKLIADYGVLPARNVMIESVDKTCADFATHEAEIYGHTLLMTATHYRNDRNGAILLCRENGADWTDHDRSLLGAVAGQLGIALRQIENQTELERLSRTDSLTGLFNRRAFTEELERALVRSRRNRQPGAIFFVDLNNFKSVNDIRGHDFGDRVLKELAKILKHAARSYDFVARLGGDEFALWFDNIEKDSARRRGQEILRNSRHLEELSGTPRKPLGLSIGIAMFQFDTDETSDALLKRADAAMYRAKQSRKHLTLAGDDNSRDAEH